MRWCQSCLCLLVVKSLRRTTKNVVSGSPGVNALQVPRYVADRRLGLREDPDLGEEAAEGPGVAHRGGTDAVAAQAFGVGLGVITEDVDLSAEDQRRRKVAQGGGPHRGGVLVDVRALADVLVPQPASVGGCQQGCV